MRNLATCYSEHAVKVSDSYCSGPLSNKPSFVSPKSIQSIQNHVTCTYKSQISNNKYVYITITWCSKLICQGFFIKITENLSNNNNNNNNNNSTHGFHQINKTKGSKSVRVESSVFPKADLHWDLSSARYEAAGPVPLGGFYVAATLAGSQCALVVGDLDDTHGVANLLTGLNRPELALVSQYEQFTGQWTAQINSRAKICASDVDHEIVIKCGPEDDGPKIPVLGIYVDKKRVVKVNKLQWNFRGNQVIFVDGLLVDVMWDVYGWYFDHNLSSINNNNNNNNNNNRGGLFMFRTRSGLDSRLWLEEQEKKLGDKIHDDRKEFSLLICVSSKNPS
ncbi:hypothetical protein vseg_013235 [Gypsophila vaccaria]